MESTISEYLPHVVPRPKRTPEQIAADAESAVQRQRIAEWQLLATKLGDRYARCFLDRWKFHGDPQQQERQRGVIAQAQAYARQLPERVQAGSGVFVLGPPGTGKDFLVSALMREAILRYGLKVSWVNGVDLYAAIRDAISADTAEAKLIRQWVSPQILVLSDPVPPRGTLTEFQTATLFRIVDGRYRANRPTWVTINVAKREEADERLGPQVVSRLLDAAMIWRCEWEDFRAKTHST